MFRDFIYSFAKAQIDGAMTKVLEMVKEDHPEVDVAQSKYGYRLGANDMVDKELAWAVLNSPKFPILDFLAEHDGLVTHWELLHSSVDVAEDYVRLKAEEGWESMIDRRRFSLIQESVVDPSVASSSGRVLYEFDSHIRHQTDDFELGSKSRMTNQIEFL